MSGTENNEDIGYHDLLFNSAVACILLFIIFSVKVGAHSTVAAIGSRSGAMSSSYSVVPSEKVGEMITLRMVKITGLSETTLSLLKSQFQAGTDIGQWGGYDAQPVPDSPIPTEQMYIEGNSIIFSLALGTLSEPNITFSITPGTIPTSEGNVRVQGILMEGAGALKNRETFDGYFETKSVQSSSSSIRVDFRITNEETLKNLIIINQ